MYYVLKKLTGQDEEMEVDFILNYCQNGEERTKSGYSVLLKQQARLGWGKISCGMGLSPGVS